jgi:hypothetical protein
MSMRESAKLLGGSMVVYVVATSLPSYDRRTDSCDGTKATGSLLPSSEALAAEGEHVAGARLAPVYLEGDDGSRQFLGWHDAARDVDCSFAIAADGAWRCLPSGADAGRFFADAACTQRLATVPRVCGSPPGFAVVRDVPACVWQQSRQVFSLGERYTGPLAYWLAAGACAAVSSNDLAAYDLYAVGDEVHPSSFVSATAVVER